MELFSIIKRNSRLALRGSWGRAIIILLIMAGVSFLIVAFTQMAVSMFVPLPDSASYNDIVALAADYEVSAAEWIILAVATALWLLLVAPLSLGAARWYYRLVHGERMPVTELFYYFERGRSYVRAVFYEINITIRMILWVVLFYTVPSVIYGIALFFLSGNEQLTRAGIVTATLGIFLSIMLFLLMTLFYAVWMFRYILARYLIAEDDDLTVSQAIKLSVKYTKGFRFSLLWFTLSYIGWFLLAIFLWPILYVRPYYSTGIAMYSRFIIEKNHVAPVEATQEFSAEEILPEAAFDTEEIEFPEEKE